MDQNLGPRSLFSGVSMASREGQRRRQHNHNLVPLAALISQEARSERLEKPSLRYGNAAQSRKGEDYFLMKTDCQRLPGNPSSTFSVFAVSYLPLVRIALVLFLNCKSFAGFFKWVVVDLKGNPLKLMDVHMFGYT